MIMNRSISIDLIARMSRLIALAALVAGLALSAPHSAEAAVTIKVDTPSDELNVDGDCSLREALAAANTDKKVDACKAGNGTDTIAVPAGTYTLTLGSLAITSKLKVSGAGASKTLIDGGGAATALTVASGATATIASLTIQNGYGIESGGIDTQGALTLKSSTVRNNMGIVHGGGIYNRLGATLTLIDSTISGNTGREANGGGILNDGTLTLQSSTVTQNKAEDADGGGIYNAGALTLKSSTVDHNQADAGGGIYNRGSYDEARGIATLSGSTVDHNQAQTGGGIYNYSTAELGIGKLLVSGGGTISANTAQGDGGAIFNAGRLTMSDSTISGNTAEEEGGGLFHMRGQQPIVGTKWDKVIVKNTIMAGNTNSIGLPSECVGQMVSQGYNLIKNPADCTIEGDTRTNILGQPANLGPLQNNGGPTLTYAPQPGSPAIDKIPAASCADVEGYPLTVDQRGILRPHDGDGTKLCDIGAVEL
jgi:CSLREA domain-containing protein